MFFSVLRINVIIIFLRAVFYCGLKFLVDPDISKEITLWKNQDNSGLGGELIIVL